jgi:hypothetical protein
MTIEALAAMSTDVAAAQQTRVTQSAGVNFSLHDVARFETAMSAQSASAVPNGTAATAGALGRGENFMNSPGVRAMFDPLERINSSTERMLVSSEKLLNPDAGPGEMVMTLMSAQKFMFECQLTSSVANRTSDGVQELFRQQA